MSTNYAIITKIKVTPHPDPEVHSLAVGEVCNETLIVGKDTQDGQLGIYFPCDLQLSEEFANKNDLIRRKGPNGEPLGGMFEENRRVKAIKLRGVKSNGFWCPLSHLSHFGDVSSLKEGDKLDTFCGTKICNKYVSKRHNAQRGGIQSAKKKLELCFPQHKDTEQLKYNVDKIGYGCEVIVTEKVHGTSQRVGIVSVERDLSLGERCLQWLGFKIETHALRFMNGTRRVIISEDKTGFHCPKLRTDAANKLKPFLEHHMVVYFEVVGYEESGSPIMGTHDNSKLKSKDIVKQFGKTTTYKYGCQIGEFDIYVYRIAYVLPNGHVIDLSWDEVKEKCNSWGVKHVPELDRYTVTNPDSFVKHIDSISDGESTIDHSHIREGVCVRINKHGWHTFKNKGFTFKVLEGIMKDNEDYVDVEEES